MRDDFIRSLTPEQFAAWKTLDKMNVYRLATFLAAKFEEHSHDKEFVRTFRDVMTYVSSSELQSAIESDAY